MNLATKNIFESCQQNEIYSCISNKRTLVLPQNHKNLRKPANGRESLVRALVDIEYQLLYSLWGEIIQILTMADEKFREIFAPHLGI